MSSSSGSAGSAGRGEGSARPVVATLDNGAEILVLRTDRPAGGLSGAGVAAVQLWVLGGTNAEEEHEHGCAHLLEHLLFKPATVAGGATSDLAKGIEALGGDVNAYTSHDETVFHATVPAPEVLSAIDGLLGPVLVPRFDPQELRAEVEVVVEEILQDKDDPSARLSQDVASALFSAHGYGRPVLGTVRSVRGHDAARLRAFHRRVYAGRRLLLVVVGPVDPRPVIARARPWLSARTRGRAVPEHADLVVHRTRPFVRVRRLDVVEAHFQIGWSAPPLPVADACALELASVVLGYGEASRLSTRVRRKARAVTDAYASLYGSRVASSVVVGGHAPPGRAASAIERVLDEIDALAHAPISHEELARAKAVVRSDVVYRRETGAGQAHALGYFLSIGGGLKAEERYFRHVEALEPADVMRACGRWLSGSSAALAVAVPESEDAAQARAWSTALRRRLSRRASGGRPRARGGKRRESGIVTIDHQSGVRVRAIVDRRVPIAAGWLLWPGGLRLETDKTHGSSAMMAKLLTRGCADLDGDALAREIEGRAAVLDGFCGRHSAGLHFESVAPDFGHVLRRALECATGPTFAASELEEERRVELESIAAEADDLGKVAMRTVLSLLYEGHPYRLRRRGSPATLRAMTSGELLRRWPAWYPISRAVLGLCGDLDLDGIVAVLDGELSGPPARARQKPRFPAGKVTRGRKARVRRRAAGRDREQVHLAVGMPGLSFHDDRVAVLDVLVAILGGQVGRLFHRLREREGLVYHVSATAAHGVDAGDVLVYAATGRDKAARARAAVRQELDSVATTRVSPDELEHARAYLRGQYDAELERRSRVASLLALDEAFDLGAGAFSQYPAQLEAVTAADVLSVAEALFAPASSVTAIVG